MTEHFRGEYAKIDDETRELAVFGLLADLCPATLDGPYEKLTLELRRRARAALAGKARPTYRMTRKMFDLLNDARPVAVVEAGGVVSFSGGGI